MQIHQTLHGYRDGHRLLAASRNLPTDTIRQMLLLSEMSGPSMVDGFDTYLTAYPLPEIATYAFARTWYASEMKRPGCVWTHTFLIDFSDLESIDHLEKLNACFRRPSDTFHSYTSPLLASDFLGLPVYSRMTPLWALQLLSNALYRKPEKPIVLTADRPQTFDLSVLAVWSQMWPRLRRNITFCTGALSPRFFNSKPFDLQVIPSSSFRLFTRDLEAYAVATGLENLDDVFAEWPKDGWLSTVTEDLLLGFQETRQLKSFLWKYSVDVAASRSSFIIQVETFRDVVACSRGEISVAKLVFAIAQRFPESNQAATLKEDLFSGEKSTVVGTDRSLLEADILRELAETESYSAFNTSSWHLQERAKQWTAGASLEAGILVQHLLNTNITPVGGPILGGILEGFDPDAAVQVARQQHNLFPFFVSRYPFLAASIEAWQGSLDYQQHLLDVLFTADGIEWERVIPAILEAEADGIASDLIEKLGIKAVNCIIEWFGNVSNLSKLPSVVTSNEWIRVLALHPHLIVEYLRNAHEPKIEILALAASVLDPHSKDVLVMADTTWLVLAKGASASLDQTRLVSTMAFLLSIAFQNYGKASSEIVVYSFEIVHNATAMNQLPQASWRLIEHQVPPAYEGMYWDKCERLREAVVNLFRVHRWAPADLFRAVRNDDTFARIIEYCKQFAEGKDYLKKLRNYISKHPSVATVRQKEILAEKKILRWF